MVTVRERRWGKKGKSWAVDYRDAGRRHRVHFKIRKNADEFARLKETEIERKRNGLSSVTPIKFEEWADIFCRNHFKVASERYAKKTIDMVKKVYVPEIGAAKYLHQITTADIENFRDLRLAKNLSSKTVINDLCTLNVMFTKAVEHSYNDFNPVEAVAMPRRVARKVRDAVPMELIEEFCRGCSEQTRRAIIILVNTGIRLGELFQLRGKDFDLANGFVKIVSEEGRTTKNLKTRIVPIGQVVKDLVQDVPKDALVMRVKCNTVESSFDDHRRKIGHKWTLHELRHTYISRMLKEGVDKRTLREYVGHQSDAILDRYSHFIPEKIAAKVNFGGSFLKPAAKVVTIWSQETQDIKKPLENQGVLVPGAGLEPALSNNNNNLDKNAQIHVIEQNFDKSLVNK